MNTPRAVTPFWRRREVLQLFATCWLLFTLHFATNTVREIYPALSLGDHLSFDVSEYAGLHPDIFEMEGRGTFINNNPGASIMGAVPYTLARPVIDRVVSGIEAQRAASGAEPPEYDTIYPLSREFYRRAYVLGYDVKFGLAAGVMQAGLMAPLSALSVVIMYRVLLALAVGRRAALWLALLYGFATPILYRTAQLNHNLLVGHVTLFSFVLLWRPWAAGEPLRPWHWLVAGLLAGWAVVLDYSGLVSVAALSLYALARYRGVPATDRTLGPLVGFAAGVIASGLVLMGYQWLAFGHPIWPAQRYMPATPFSGAGFSGMTLPDLRLLWQTAFGIRFGLFVSAPLLLLALYPRAWRDRAIRLLPSLESRFALGYTIGFFLFAAASQYGYLQFNSGVRYIVPVVPYLFLIAAGVLRAMPTRVAIGVGLLGTYWSWALAMYRDVEQGLGVFEAIIAITTGGVRLPWLTTLRNLGYLPALPLDWLFLILALLVILLIWRPTWRRSGGGRLAPPTGERL